MAMRNSTFCYWHQPAPTKDVAGPGYDVRAALALIISDPRSGAQARTGAARTLAELDGLIGRHQQAPERSSSALLATLSRDDLAHELARLRQACAQDKAWDKG